MSRRILLYCSLFLILLSSSCRKKGPVVGFMLPHMSIARYPVERDEFTKKIKELGGDVVFMSADNDEVKQNRQITEIINQVDVLVLDPVNRFQAAGMVRAAHEKKIPVISYDRLVANCNVDAYVSFDANATGSKMAAYALNAVPTGNYIILDGDRFDINAVKVDEGIRNTLAPAINSGKIKVKYRSFIELYSADETQYQTRMFLNLSQELPDAIICSSDVIAKGAINEIKNQKIDKKIVVIGQGPELFACKEMLKGNQSMSIYKPVRKLADLAAEMAIEMSKGKKAENLLEGKMNNGTLDVPTRLLDVMVVDSSNIKSTVIADGLINEKDLYN